MKMRGNCAGLLLMVYFADGAWENKHSTAYASNAAFAGITTQQPTSGQQASSQTSFEPQHYLNENFPALINLYNKGNSRVDVPWVSSLNTGSTKNNRQPSGITNYPSPPSYYPELNYDNEYNYGEDKKKKIAASIVIPLALVLGPLAFIGLIALFSIRTIVTIQIIQSLCTNPEFSGGFENLCTIVLNIKKRSNSKEDILNKLFNSETLSEIMSSIQHATYTALDHLSDDLNNKTTS